MTTNTYHAQPYDMNKTGFYFTDMDSYLAGVEASGAEEFELQFIDGDREQACLFDALKINQATLVKWFDEVEELDDWQKPALYWLTSDRGYSLEDALEIMDDVSLTEDTLQNAAEQLFDEIYLHDVPESVRSYIDYDKFANDCRIGGDMDEFEFNGSTYTVTNANCV